jgi:hypothetical protein
MSNHVNKNWIHFRESYINWLADWPKSYDIKKLLNYQGYSLWWSSNFIKKDIILDIDWIADLYKRLEDKNIDRNPSIGRKRTPIFIFYIFILDIYRFFILKLFLRKRDAIADIYFYSIQLNIIKKDNLYYDRHYGGALEFKNSSNLSSSYLLALSNDYFDILSPFKYRNKINKILNSLDSEVIILDKYLTLTNILSVHFSTFKIYLLFLKEKRKKVFTDSFVIDGIPCSDILIKELEKGFYGGFQSSLMSGLQLLNWSSSQSKDLIVVSYLETLAAARPLYHFARKSKINTTFVALQHSTIYKNKIDFYNREEEFNYYSDNSINFSPQPDFYLLHGEQAKEMVSEFINKDRLEVIGCVKYDQFIRTVNNLENIRRNVNSTIGHSNMFTILLAPSFGVDLSGMLKMFENVTYDFSKIRFIISPHPLVSISSIMEIISLSSIKVKFDFFPEFSTQDLAISSDLVVCGYSSLAIEALIFETPSIRIIRDEQIPLFENEDSIMYIENKDKFWKYIDSCFDSSTIKNSKEDITKLISFYLFKIDGNAKDRMWSFLKKIQNTNNKGIEKNEKS